MTNLSTIECLYDSQDSCYIWRKVNSMFLEKEPSNRRSWMVGMVSWSGDALLLQNHLDNLSWLMESSFCLVQKENVWVWLTLRPSRTCHWSKAHHHYMAQKSLAQGYFSVIRVSMTFRYNLIGRSVIKKTFSDLASHKKNCIVCLSLTLLRPMIAWDGSLGLFIEYVHLTLMNKSYSLHTCLNLRAQPGFMF